MDHVANIEAFLTKYQADIKQSNDPSLQDAVKLLRTILADADFMTSNPAFSQEIETVCRGIGHNFNGVLANIRGTAEITQLKSPNLPEDANTGLNNILSLTERGEYSTEMIRMYGKAFNMQTQPINLAAELQRMVNDIKMSMDVTFPIHLAVSTEANLQLNQETLDGCFRILMKNALQAIQYGQQTQPEIHVALQISDRVNQGVCLSIKDNGQGMSEQTRSKAKQAFFTTRKAAEGLGLGLTVVNNFAIRHGGQLEIDSQEGQGSCISLHLPTA